MRRFKIADPARSEGSKARRQPDLVVRYWPIANPRLSLLARTWGQFGQYVSDYWAYTYD